MFSDSALAKFRDFLAEDRRTRPGGGYGPKSILGYDQASGGGTGGSRQGSTTAGGGGSGMQEGTHQAFRRENADAMKGHDDGPVAPEPQGGPQVQINTNSPQEGTGAAGTGGNAPQLPGAPPEGIDTHLHGTYRRYWKARDGVNLKYAEGTTQDQYVDPETGTSSNESGMSPNNIGTNLRDGGVKAGLHSEAVDSYGELAGGLFEIDPAACAALEAVLTAQGFSPADAKRVVMQHLIAPMAKANFDRGTGAPAQDTPPDFREMPKVGKGPDRCMAGDHIGHVGISYSPQDLEAPRYSRYSLDLAAGAAAGLDPRKAHDRAVKLAVDRANERSGTSPIFASSGAGKIGFAA